MATREGQTLGDVDAEKLRAAMAQVRDETGQDLLDRQPDRDASSAVYRRAYRQIDLSILAGLVGALALIAVLMGVLPGDQGVGVRVVVLVVAVLLVAGCVALDARIRDKDPSFAAAMERRAAWRRLHEILGLPVPRNLREIR